jgi:hypothetical protein
MRTSTLFFAMALAAPAIGQIPLPAFGNTFTASLTRGYWFQAPVPFVITGLQVPNEAGQPFQVVEVINLGAAPPAFPGTVVGTQLFYDNTTAGGSLIPCAIPIAAGDFIGVLGACTATVGGATSYNSYAATSGPFTSSILGNPVTLTRFGTQSGIGANGGNQPCWQEAAFQISRVEMYVAPASGFAFATPYGAGCYNAVGTSFYENFGTSASFDLASTSVSLVHTGSGYLAIAGLATYVPPSGSATVLALTDDSETAVGLSQPFAVPGAGTTSSLMVCSNGYISAGAGNGTAFTPTTTTLLNGTQAMWSLCWHDYNPAIVGSGQVKFEEVAGVAYITWDGVWDFGGTSAANANTMQAQFEFATGTVHFVYQATSVAGNGRLVGFSEGGPSADPGSIDLSALLAAGPFQAATFTVLPLALGASARPVIGTNITLDTTNVPAAAVLGLNFLGLTEITGGIDLTAIGMPGCSQYVSLDVSSIWFPAGGAGTTPFNIPNTSALAGVQVNSQSAAIVPGVNALGALSSNGLRLVLDVN